MPDYVVRLYDRGAGDGGKTKIVEADSEQGAAELLAGETVQDSGKRGQLRAEVWPLGRETETSRFYTRACGWRMSGAEARQSPGRAAQTI